MSAARWRKRGKNKQGRGNLRQVSYALFCCADGHLPLFYDVYDGNRNDAKQFPVMLRRFQRLLPRVRAAALRAGRDDAGVRQGQQLEDNFR